MTTNKLIISSFTDHMTTNKLHLLLQSAYKEHYSNESGYLNEHGHTEGYALSSS